MIYKGWKYRKPITISNSGSSLTDYQVLVTNPIYNENGLVGSWHFNEGSGTIVYDSSGKNNNGIISGATWTTSGKFGNALSFDGTDDYVGGLGNFGSSNTLTIELWFKTSNASWDILFGQTDNTPPNTSNSSVGVLAIKDTGVLRAELWTGSYGEISTSFSVRDGYWHQAVLVGNINTQSLYVDGNFIGSRNGNINLSWCTYSFIGTGYESPARGFPTLGWHYFNGLIDEVRIYNRALSSDEISALYNAKARPDYEDIRFADNTTELSYWKEADGRFWVKVPSIPSGNKTIYVYYGKPSATSQSSVSNTFIREINSVKGSWHMDEGSGTTIADTSGNGNNGTISGATWTTSGKFGNALSFDGVDDRVSLGTNGIPSGNSPYAIAVWVKTTSTGNIGVVGWGNWGTTNQVNAVKIYNNYIYNYWWLNDLIVYVSDISNGYWHFIVAQFDGTTRSIWVDGVNKGQDTPTGHNAIVTDVNIGTTNTTQYFNGLIDEVKIFNQALTSDEISDLYNNYGYTTTAYAGKVLVRKYTSSEPTTTIGAERKVALGSFFAFF